MNKNYLRHIEKTEDDKIHLRTDHFSVTFHADDNATDTKNGLIISLKYDVTHKTTYATRYKIKKFLKKLVMDGIKEQVKLLKESNNG